MALAVAVILGGSVPVAAHANGMGHDGPVSVGVLGNKLHVDKARVLFQGWHAGMKARIVIKRPEKRTKPVTERKYTRAREVAGHQFEYAEWRIDRDYPNGSRMCAQVKGHSQKPCATIHS
nr:hypothetical protein [Streptomyces sabulosicollis]